MAKTERTIEEVIGQLRALGVAEGGVLLAHVSYRAARPIEDGPQGLITALLGAIGPRGTMVTPSWEGSSDRPFDPARSPARADLGVVADVFWRLPGVRRSDHPFAFAALGPQAERITGDPLPLPPHGTESPAGRVRELDGQVLLIGCGHDADTTLHLAELVADVAYRAPKHCTVMRGGRPIRIDYLENDHCCQRFAEADAWLRAKGLQHEGLVGHAPSRLARSRDIVDAAVEKLSEDPLIFLHPAGAGCEECDDTRRHSFGGSG